MRRGPYNFISRWPKWIKKIVKSGLDTYLIDASISIDEINDEMKINIPEGRYETLAGFIIDMLQTIPEINTRTNFRGYRFTIMELQKNKISKVQIRVPSGQVKKNVAKSWSNKSFKNTNS